METCEENTLVGQVLQDTYRIEQLIGKGGMGIVYGATHVRLTRRYAVKLLNPLVATSAEAVARFKREAQVTGSLGHPNIVEVYDFNHTPEGVPYLIMEFLEGESLGARIRRQGRLSFSEAASIFRQAASAIAAVHAKGIIHRDLKPENIFLCKRDGQPDLVKVVDFGLSKILGYEGSLTGSHDLIGSPYYMAPEQAEQRTADIDLRTDIYGMGVIVFMMLAGHPPFQSDTLPTLLYKIVNSPPPSLHALSPDIPQAVDDVVQMALRKQREDRFQVIVEFWQAFNRAVLDESMGSTAAPESLAARPEEEEKDKEVGRQIGNYVIKRKLSEGGMGVVYLAEHPEIGRQVAIKILATHLLQYPMAAERFIAEAKAVTRIKHPNIIDIYDFGRLDDGRLYYVMELLEGVELRQVMNRGKMAPAEVVRYLDQIGQALQAAHDHGIVHRDLKPENIFELDRQPFTIKVLDFGIAKLLEPGGSQKGITSTGMVMGSPQTMAPEQAAGMPERVGPWTDLYSLGVVLYWMMAGRPPFSAEAAGLLLAKHITEQPPPLREAEPSIPPGVAEVVERCLEKDTTKRPGSALELARSFAEAVRSAGSSPPPDPRGQTGVVHESAARSPTTMQASAGEVVGSIVDRPPRNRSIWLAAAAAVCLVGLAIGFLAIGKRGSAPAAGPKLTGVAPRPAVTARPTDAGTSSRVRPAHPDRGSLVRRKKTARPLPAADRKPAVQERIVQPKPGEAAEPPRRPKTKPKKKGLPFEDLDGKKKDGLRFRDL